MSTRPGRKREGDKGGRGTSQILSGGAILGAALLAGVSINFSTGPEWRGPPPERVALVNSSTCTIERLNETEWEARFTLEFYLKKPAILHWTSSGALETLRARTQRSVLLREHGHVHVNLDRFRNLWQPGSSTKASLSEYVESLPPANGEYLFDTGEFLKETGLDRNWRTAPGLAKTGRYRDSTDPAGIITIALGGDKQGIPFHWHGDAYSVQLHGAKLWVVFPPGRMPSSGFLLSETLEQWLVSRQNKKVDADLTVPSSYQCVQKPGELLYVPEGFWHATSCVGDAVAITEHSVENVPGSAYDLYHNASDLLAEWIDLAKRRFHTRPAAKQKLASATSLLKSALLLDPTNAEILLKLELAAEARGDTRLAIATLRRAIQANPLCIKSHSTLIKMLEKLGAWPLTHL
eukprot:COSAG02_NODE_3474_length_6681_cov_29.310696_4_plen_407_part_00